MAGFALCKWRKASLSTITKPDTKDPVLQEQPASSLWPSLLKCYLSISADTRGTYTRSFDSSKGAAFGDHGICCPSLWGNFQRRLCFGNLIDVFRSQYVP